MPTRDSPQNRKLMLRTETEIITLAERVIGASNRKHSADSVLREVLNAEHGLSKAASALASRAVFAYFRWKGWLDESKPVRSQITEALQLAERFKREPEKFSDADMLARAVPDWLAAEMDITAAWVRSLQAEPKLWLRAQHARGKAISAQLGGCRAFGDGLLADILEYVGDADLFRTTEFQAGEFEIQDISSQAVGLICAPLPGQTWWDVCAGEGGKTLHLSALMQNRGLIWASDRAAWRLQKLRRRTARARVFNYRAAGWNGGAKLPTKTKFDGVLVDAPCSGIGTWQRNPHARWTTSAQDLKELGALQKQLLCHASAAVKPGGKLIYAVCTLVRSETTEVVETFEAQDSDFARLAVRNPLEVKSPASAPLYFWPQQYGGNGMFVTVWTRTGSA